MIDATVAAIAETGLAGISLRDLARRVGVSHAAPVHHFGDKAGLLSAVAVEGYRLLADTLRHARQTTGSFLEVGVAYVRFAIEHRPHFEVMFRPELYRADDPDVVAARQASGELLYGPVAELAGDDHRFDVVQAGIAGWSLVHGFATLWLNGNLPHQLGDDPEAAARAVAGYLFRPPPGRS
jgi:AcrR family transcriptional regulator